MATQLSKLNLAQIQKAEDEKRAATAKPEQDDDLPILQKAEERESYPTFVKLLVEKYAHTPTLHSAINLVMGDPITNYFISKQKTSITDYPTINTPESTSSMERSHRFSLFFV